MTEEEKKMREINERDLQNVSGGKEPLTLAAQKAEQYCGACLSDYPYRQCEGWGALTKYIEDHPSKADFGDFRKCPFFKH